MLLWAFATVTALVALVAYERSRRLARKLEWLTQSYWELRHQQGLLRAAVERSDPAKPGQDVDQRVAAGAGEQVAFVPLSSVKR